MVAGSKRHRFFKRLAWVGVVVSCFLAFDHVNSELKEQRDQVTLLKAQLVSTNDTLKDTQAQLQLTIKELVDARKWDPLAPKAKKPCRGGPTLSNIKTSDTQGVDLYMPGNADCLNINGFESKRTKGTVFYLGGSEAK
jgi:ribosomal protein S13